MAHHRDDGASSFSEDKDPPIQPSIFMSSLIKSRLDVRRPVTINTENPLNPAIAYPAFHVGIDAKPEPPKSDFSIRMQNLNDGKSQLLASAAAGRPNTYRPRSVVAKERTEKIIAAAANSRKRRTMDKINPAPGREGSPRPTANRRRAAMAGEKTRKRQAIQSDDEYGVTTGEEEEEVMEAPKKKRSSKRQSKSAAASKPASKPAAQSHNNTTASSVTMPATTSTAGSGRSLLLKKRDPGLKVPKSLSEAGPADLMLWEWKHAGKDWKDIHEEWARLTGKKPGKSTLSVRFIKLTENMAANGGADDMVMLKYKEDAESELQSTVWEKVAGKIEENHDVKISPEVLRKRFNALKKSGFQVGKDIDEDEEVAAAAAAAAAAAGDPNDEGTRSARTAATLAEVTKVFQKGAGTTKVDNDDAERSTALVDYSESDD